MSTNRTNRQIELCSARIANPVARERFVELLTRANKLSEQARNLRLLAWADYRRVTGLGKRERTYA